MKMDRLTNTQRIKIIKTYYRNGDSATATYHTLRGDYGLHNRPTTQAINKIVTKFEETGVVTNIERPVHHRFARSAKNIAFVSESVAEDFDSSPFSGIRTVLRYIIAYFPFRSTPTFI